MGRDVYTFFLKGVVIFLLLELLFYPFRETFASLLGSLLPEGFSSAWECTGLDEVFLFLAFLIAYPAPPKYKVLPALLGSIVIELYNAIRIVLVVVTRSALLHDILFRWGGFILVLLLFYLTFRYLSRASLRPRS